MKFLRRPYNIVAVLCLLLACLTAGATVTAYTGPIPADEAPSPYYKVEAGGVVLHVYQAQVRANNFTTFTSQFTNQTFNAALGVQKPYTANLGIASFASFQLDGYNTVLITFPTGYPHKPITSPSQINILPAGAVDPATITFTSGSIHFPVSEKYDPVTGQPVAQQLTVEVDGDWMNSLHLFINPPDTAPTDGYMVPPGIISAATFSSQPSPLYIFGPGEYWVNGNLDFPNGAELYLEDGAIIKWMTPPAGQTNTHPMILLGTLHGNAPPVVNATIRGWGILDGQAREQQAAGTTGNCGSDTSPLELNSITTSPATKINVDGIVIRNSCTWNFPLWNVQGTPTNPVTINNIKILGYSGTNPNQAGSDGIDIVTSRYINVTHSFIRTNDDLIVVKQAESPAPYPTTNINVTGNILWNELAHALSIGAEVYNAYNASQPSNPLGVDNVTFDSNDIIHDTGKCFLLGILSSYTGKVQNIFFDNTTVEENRALIGIELNPQTGSTANPGIVGSVKFTNVTVTAPQQVQTLGGGYIAPVPNIQLLISLPYGNPYAGNGKLTGTYPAALQAAPTFTNVVVNGQLVSSTMEGEDYYYLGSGDPAPMPAHVVEETVKLRNADGTYTYKPEQINFDMTPPAF